MRNFILGVVVTGLTAAIVGAGAALLGFMPTRANVAPPALEKQVASTAMEVGAACAVLLFASSKLWGGTLPALLTVAAGIAITGGLHEDGRHFEYRMTVRTSDAANYARLATELAAIPAVREFHLSPAGD